MAGVDKVSVSVGRAGFPMRIIGPHGVRVYGDPCEAGDIMVSNDLRMVGRVMEPIAFAELNWGLKIKALNPAEWSADELARSYHEATP